MPDLLSHVFIAFALATMLSWRYDWLTSRYVTVAMIGSFIPDLSKVGLLVDSNTVAATLNLPFSWFGIHTLGGSLVAVLIGVALVPSAERRRVFALLSLGAGSQLAADALLVKASGHSYAILWPLTGYYPPTPGLYLSTNVWPAFAAGALALTVWALDRQFDPDR